MTIRKRGQGMDTATRQNEFCVPLALNPSTRKCDWTIYLDRDFVRWCRNRGMGATKELVFLVPQVLKDPTCVFRGLRWERDESRKSRDRPGWLCYCGLPDKAFLAGGRAIPPYQGEVFLVFLDDDKYVYHCGWEEADAVHPTKPVNRDEREPPRFKAMVFQRSERRP